MAAADPPSSASSARLGQSLSGDEWSLLEKHDSFVCPLTLELMKDPVSTVDGHTYERKAIEEWLETNDTSPLTAMVLADKQLIPNLAIKQSIEEFLLDAQSKTLAQELTYRKLTTRPAAIQKRVNVLVVGSAGVGKSSLLRRLIAGDFTQETTPTYGIDYQNHCFEAGDHSCQAKVWDTSGQPHLKDTVRTQYRLSNCIIFVFDVTRWQTLKDLEQYIEAAKDELASRPHELVLVGNKIDDQEKRVVSAEDASQFVQAHGLHDYRETSAKNGANVELTFRNALTHSAYRASVEAPQQPARPRAFNAPPCCRQ